MAPYKPQLWPLLSGKSKASSWFSVHIYAHSQVCEPRSSNATREIHDERFILARTYKALSVLSVRMGGHEFKRFLLLQLDQTIGDVFNLLGRVKGKSLHHAVALEFKGKSRPAATQTSAINGLPSMWSWGSATYLSWFASNPPLSSSRFLPHSFQTKSNYACNMGQLVEANIGPRWKPKVFSYLRRRGCNEVGQLSWKSRVPLLHWHQFLARALLTRNQGCTKYAHPRKRQSWLVRTQKWRPGTEII